MSQIAQVSDRVFRFRDTPLRRGAFDKHAELADLAELMINVAQHCREVQILDGKILLHIELAELLQRRAPCARRI